jgi:hypothetical protein
MGFELPTYRLKWPEGSIWHGLEVRMSPMPIATLEKVGEAYEIAKDDQYKLLPLLAAIVQEGIVDWNVTKDGEPVPCTDMRSQGVELVTAILNAWQQVANEVNPPLPQGSPDGEPSPAVLMPMEIPSASHVNSNTPN